MLQASLFPDFKGANTLLLWGDAEGVSDLRQSMAGLWRGDISAVSVSDLLISVSKNDGQQSELSLTGNGLVWVCPPTVLADAQELIAGLDEAPSGHQFIDISGLADQVIISKGEYPGTLWP